jgi:hypothetical protein
MGTWRCQVLLLRGFGFSVSPQAALSNPTFRAAFRLPGRRTDRTAWKRTTPISISWYGWLRTATAIEFDVIISCPRVLADATAAAF